MDRLACVNLPAFPLQLLFCRDPACRKLPAVVVKEDKPQAPILWANDCAREKGVLPGQRYAYGLSLTHELRAGVISGSEQEKGIKSVAKLLREYSPEVEPDEDVPGVFWLDASGLERIFKTPKKWATAAQKALKKKGFVCALTVGFSRFGAYALARAQGEQGAVLILRSPEEEAEMVRRVPLAYLNFSPVLRDELAKLGVTNLGAFLRLPQDGLAERFGDEARKLHALASGATWDPLQPVHDREPLRKQLLFDDAIKSTDRLLFALRRPVDNIVAELAERKTALATLFVQFEIERTKRQELHAIRPAEPTLDARTVLRLLHLRLESRPPRQGVVEAVLTVEEVAATREQLRLFSHRPKRDLRDAEEAFARLRAEFGNQSVVAAVLKDGHMPEARYGWEPLQGIRKPEPSLKPRTSLVRRIYGRPKPLPRAPREPRNDGWLLLGLEHGPIARLQGPFVVAGGWWQKEVHREYHYAETESGVSVWIFYDRRRRAWFLHGLVE